MCHLALRTAHGLGVDLVALCQKLGYLLGVDAADVVLRHVGVPPLDFKAVSAAGQAVAFREGVVARVLLVDEPADVEACAIRVELDVVPAACEVGRPTNDLIRVGVPQEGAQVGDRMLQDDCFLHGVCLLA